MCTVYGIVILEVSSRVCGLLFLLCDYKRTFPRTFLMLIFLGLVGRMIGLPQIARQQKTLLELLLHTWCRLLRMTRLILKVNVGLQVIIVGPSDVNRRERLLLRRRFLLPRAA